MKFLSLFSGIEAASVAWNPLGWECAGVAEVEPFPCSLLKHHYPHVPNLGDVTKITAAQVKALGHIDLVCGGFPCQDLSVAGKRKGLNHADGTATRSGLFFDAMRIADWANPRWLFIENVPGMFSSNGGRDFAAVVGEMAGCEFDVPRDGWRNAGVVVGPSGLVEWSVMDAQYHGLAQRRKRVFIVRDSGDWANRPPIFLEPYRLQGHPAPRRQAGQAVTGTLSARTEGGGGLGTDFDCSGGVQPVAGTLCVATGQAGAEIGAEIGADMAPTLNCNHEAPYVASYAIQAGALRTNPLSGPDGVGVQASIAYTLEARAEVQAVAVALRGREGGATAELGDEVGNCLRASGGGGDKAHILAVMAVRRLTPDECEKLQGFPEVKKNVKIRACLDHQNPSASAETQCLKLPNNARSAEPGASPPSASVAGQSSSTSPPSQSGRVAVNVQIDLERMHLHLHSAGRLLLSVSLAEPQSRYPLLTQLGNIAPLLVQVLATLERTTTAGRAASHPHTNPSLHQLNGSPFVELSGQEIGEFANDAETFTKKASAFTKFITSQAGQSFLSCSETLRTLCCFATAAISLCIQEKTNWASSYEISIDLVQGYTTIPHRGKPAADGNRYKALGNSWAVPNITWIGRRIDEAHNINTLRKT